MKLYEIRSFTTQEKCIRYLNTIRWPKGVTCPHCKSKDISTYIEDTRPTPRQYCSSCKKGFTVLMGTVLSECRLPLPKLFKLIFLINSNPKISSIEIARQVPTTIKTALRVRKIILSVNLKKCETFDEVMRVLTKKIL